MTGIRKARPSDIDELLELEDVCYPPAVAFSRDDYRHALGGARSVNLVADESARIVGFVGAFHHKRWRAGQVYTLNVSPDARRRGVASALMAACEDRLARLGIRRLVLEVNVENYAGVALYERLGFTRGERLPQYYVAYPNNDAWRYAKALEPKREAAADA